MSSTAYADDARDGDDDDDDDDTNGGWFYRDVRDVVDGLIHSPSRARGVGSDGRGGAEEFSFRVETDARSMPTWTRAMGAMRVGDGDEDVVRALSTKAQDAIARAKAAARVAREAAVRLSLGAAATPPHLDASARRREAQSPKAVTSPLGPPRRVVRRTGAPPDLEMPTTTRRRSGDVADSARSLTRENIGRPSQSAREKALWNITRERDRGGVSAAAKEGRHLSRGAPTASSASEEATLRKLFSIAAKADPAMMRRHAVFGDNVVDGNGRNDRTAKEAVEFLSSPIKRGVFRPKPPHPRL